MHGNADRYFSSISTSESCLRDGPLQCACLRCVLVWSASFTASKASSVRESASPVDSIVDLRHTSCYKLDRCKIDLHCVHNFELICVYMVKSKACIVCAEF